MDFSSANLASSFASLSLCQNNRLSCGACCGLFNLRLDWQQLEEVLAVRTREVHELTQGFSRFVREQALRWQDSRVAREKSLGRFSEEIYVCPFLGYLDGFASSSEKRMGCLLHPNHWLTQSYELPLGVDYRDISFYGQSICETYDCPAKDNLSEAESELLDVVCRDSFSYAAVVADYRCLFFLLRMAEQLAFESQEQKAVLSFFFQKTKESGTAREAWRKWLALVYDWPYRKPNRGYVQCSFEKNWSDFGLERHLQESEAFNTKDLGEIIASRFLSLWPYVDEKLVWQLLDALNSRFASYDNMVEGIDLLACRFTELNRVLKGES